MPVVKDLARTENSLFFNPIVLDPVLADPSLRNVPTLVDPATAEANLRKNLSVSSGGTESRLVVSYTDTDREAAAVVCNAVVDSYLRQRDSFDDTRVNNLERWLEPEIQRWEQEVEERQQRVHMLSEKALGFAPGRNVDRAESESSMSRLADLRSQVGELEIELALFDATKDLPVALPPSETAQLPDAPVVPTLAETEVQKAAIREADIQEAIEGDVKVREASRVVGRYQAILLDLEVKDMVRVSRDYYNQMKENLADAQSKLDQERQVARDRALKELQRLVEEDFRQRKEVAERAFAWQQEQLKKQQQEMKRLQDKSAEERKVAQKAYAAAQAKERDNQRKVLVAKLDILKAQHDEERERMEQFGGTTAELQFANDELVVASDVLTKLRGRVAAIRTERRQDGAVRTLASATPPKSPVEAMPYKKLGMASAVAFMVPFLFGLLWELKVQRLTDAETHDKTGQLAPVLGEVARLPAGAGAVKGRRVFEESIDTLRANLFLSVDTRETRSIAIVSSMSGEGKSSVASQLALSIAKATGETVLLVDADLRCPDQHEIFGLEMGPGFTSVLSKESQLVDAVDSSLGNLIHLLPAGRLNASPHRLISPANVTAFVDAALESYEYVVFDTAPVLAAGETLAIASAVDSTLICVMRDVSRKESVLRTTRRLEASGASVAGTVFSGVSARQYGYRYGDYQYALGGEPQAT
ncbi:tyrosine-protein kinase domain-containing protein [Rhodopirellula sp. SWK7]|uniref:tyrosine-protein kinase domain-containing protein n=1 Tax=Rhodopirellula sp. SWK7 TaxID=595460 RepID=UPI001F1F7C1C|nr:AAA family ATPase [Rhodopirellula sp. SWK7]